MRTEDGGPRPLGTCDQSESFQRGTDGRKGVTWRTRNGLGRIEPKKWKYEANKSFRLFVCECFIVVARQCDHTARLFFKILAFYAMKIS